jgi:drug/metabolite transporter (DMT)-like permease
VLCCALWGGNSVAVKFTVDYIPPVGCAGLRFLVSLGVIVVWCLVQQSRFRITRAQFGIAACNALLLFVQISTFNWGTANTHAGRASVFINVHPFVVVPLARLLLDEPISWKGLLGLGYAACGVSLLFDASALALSGASLPGDLAVLFSGGLLGFQTVCQKIALRRMRPDQLLFWQVVLAVPLLFAYSAWQEGLESYQFNAQSLAGLAYQGVLVSGFCFTVWMMLLRRYQANHLAAFGFLTPYFGILFGHAFRDEPLTMNLWLGCSLVGVGLWLITRPVSRSTGKDGG